MNVKNDACVRVAAEGMCTPNRERVRSRGWKELNCGGGESGGFAFGTDAITQDNLPLSSPRLQIIEPKQDKVCKI